MNFLAAIAHAAIGYGIRRRAWRTGAILHLDNLKCLRWIDVDPAYSNKEEAQLLGPDEGFHIQSYDITATDWETV